MTIRASVPRLALVLAGCAVAACSGPPPPPAPAAAPPPAAARGASDERAEVARLVNAHRARIGCDALAWDSAAARAAQAHSEDMARRGYFAHRSPEGQGAGERVRAAGGTWRAVAENIAQGQPTAEVVVQGWLGSAGHRANIENCVYTRHGVGHAGNLWTHVFYAL